MHHQTKTGRDGNVGYLSKEIHDEQTVLENAKALTDG